RSGAALAAKHGDGARQARATRRSLRETVGDLQPIGLAVVGKPDATARLDAIDISEAGRRLAGGPARIGQILLGGVFQSCAAGHRQGETYRRAPRPSSVTMRAHRDILSSAALRRKARFTA